MQQENKKEVKRRNKEFNVKMMKIFLKNSLANLENQNSPICDPPAKPHNEPISTSVLQDQTNYDNWIPPEKRIALDEYFDMDSIKPLRVTDLEQDQSIQLLTEVEGFGSLPELCDTVQCKKETRFDSGQLVDRTEKRRVVANFELSDKDLLYYLKKAILQMRTGQVAWLKLGYRHHKGGYLAQNLSKQYNEEGRDNIRASVGDTIYIKLTMTKIIRDCKISDKSTLEEKFAYYDKIRQLCKELFEASEFHDAKKLYSRSFQTFISISKSVKAKLSVDELEGIDECQSLLSTNISTCFLKLGSPDKCIKFAQGALKIDPKNAKAQYRISQAYEHMSDLDQSIQEIKKAIHLAPQDKMLRLEYERIVQLRKDKEQKRFEKWNGFLNDNVMAEFTQSEREQDTLRDKVKRQTFKQELGLE